MHRRIGLLLCAIVLSAPAANAQAGHWKLKGTAVFTGKDNWASGDWTAKVESRSQSDVRATARTTDGKTVLTVRFQWNAPPATIQPDAVESLPGKASILTLVNPRNLGLNASIYCFNKSPYGPFWEGYLPMKAGGLLSLHNTSVHAPKAGQAWTLVYRLLGIGSALDFEYTYQWVAAGR
jgi:hypothetical protein